MKKDGNWKKNYFVHNRQCSDERVICFVWWRDLSCFPPSATQSEYRWKSSSSVVCVLFSEILSVFHSTALLIYREYKEKKKAFCIRSISKKYQPYKQLQYQIIGAKIQSRKKFENKEEKRRKRNSIFFFFPVVFVRFLTTWMQEIDYQQQPKLFEQQNKKYSNCVLSVVSYIQEKFKVLIIRNAHRLCAVYMWEINVKSYWREQATEN